MPHRARNNDPASSQEAAAHMDRTGRAAAQQDRAEAAVKQHPGMTSLELARASGIDRYTLARRLPEIEADDRVHRGQIRQCSISKRQAMEWMPGPKPSPATPQRQPIRIEEQA